MTPEETKTYLGDSVYAQFDGYGIWVTTENGNGRPSNEVYLEPDVLASLLRFCAGYFDRKSLVKTMEPTQ